jgi:sensor histidine kinase YesM
MNRKIKPYAVIMIQLNVDQIFESLSSVWEFESYQVFCNDRELTADNGASHDETPSRGDGGVYLTSRDGRDMVVMPGTVEGNRLVYAVTYNGKATRFEQRATVYIFVLNIVFMVPFLIVIIYFFNSKISRPIAELSAAAEQIAGGNYKIVVPENKSGGEISDLTKNFNQMSHQLNEQFNRIFVEEIALRDANIHALQSQINPHFLNNTLEIINWQVRMDGDEKASHMIEALSTMMEATLNREKKQEIPLSRELSYVDAYIYICKCRYGEKFMWSEDVQQDAMKCPVPRLIIQPIVENAVEHAIDEEPLCYAEGRGRAT